MSTRFPRERGAAAVEMAIVLPVLLMIIFGIVDFGRMFNTQVTLTEAAREGVRSAALGQSNADTAARVGSVTDALGGSPAPTCASPAVRSGTRTCTAVTPCTPGGEATVTVTYTFTYVTPFAALVRVFGFGAGPGATVAMSGKGVMACAP